MDRTRTCTINFSDRDEPAAAAVETQAKVAAEGGRVGLLQRIFDFIPLPHLQILPEVFCRPLSGYDIFN